MIQDTQNRKKKVYGAILCVLCAFILALTPLLAKTTFASNNFIENIVFYRGGDGFNRLKFKVKTTFEKTGLTNAFVRLYYQDGQYCAGVCNLWVCPDMATYTAGITYDKILYNNSNCLDENKNNTAYTSDWGLIFGREAGYMGFTPAWSDTEFYAFTEFPTLTMTYPFDEAEIAEAFYITGSYTLPAGSTFNKLMAYFGYDVSGQANFYEFYQDVSVPSGSVNIRVAGLPARSYLLGFSFINTSDPDDYYMILEWYNIHIVKSIPPELPDGETPPLVFDILDPASYYTANSSYASSTLLFDNLSGALKPIILTIGNNLTFFSSKFEQSKAQETGETMAGGVLVVRTYANNLNSFFSDLPIAQALFLYLLLLVVVAVFRIIKNLINLIKP